MLEFINLKQGNSSVKNHALKLTKLYKYVLKMVVNTRAHMSKFSLGVPDSVANKCKTNMLIKEMDISRLMTYVEQIEKKKLKKGL